MAITVRDVAKAAGTSTAAVSVALSGSPSGSIRISQSTRDRILFAAAELGYTPNPIAKTLSTGRSGVIGLTFPYADAFVDNNPFCSQVMNGVFAEAIRDQYHMMLYTGDGGSSHLANRLDPRIDGLIMVLPAPDDPILMRSIEFKFPVVGVVADPGIDPHLLTVNADDREGGAVATRHLIHLGHHRIAMFTGEDTLSTSRLRYLGYEDAMREAGFDVDPLLVIPAGSDWKPAYAAAKRLLARPKREWPTAIFAINDLCAAGVIRALNEHRVRVPEDIAIVGFDDTWFAAATRPALTSVRMPIREMGAYAVQLLVSSIRGETPADTSAVLPISLTVRSSCGAKGGESFTHDVLTDLFSTGGIL